MVRGGDSLSRCHSERSAAPVTGRKERKGTQSGGENYAGSSTLERPRTSFTGFFQSGAMNFSTKFCPIVSCREYPVMASAFWFHSLTKPLVSTPKMGAEGRGREAGLCQ